MRIVLILVALALISGDQAPSKPPVEAEEIWHLTLPEAIKIGLATPVPADKFMIGAVEIPNPRNSENPEPDVEWNLSLEDALRIGLENSRILETKPIDQSTGGVGLEIAPIDREGSLWKFQTEAMALVRSIESEYGNLWRDKKILEARETAVHRVEVILGQVRDEPECCRHPATLIEEVERKREDFKLDRVKATSNVILTERRLRDLLGLKRLDGRRIIPNTPVEAKVVPDWDSSLRAMSVLHPEIVEQTVIVRLCELQLVVDRNQLLPLLGLDLVFRVQSLGTQLDQVWGIMANGVREYEARNPRRGPVATRESSFIDWQIGLTDSRPSCGFLASRLPGVRQCQYQLIRQRGELAAITQAATDKLSRLFQEIEASHDQFTAEHRASVAARGRCEALRSDYERGRISDGAMLDAISQEVETAAHEARSLTAYNATLSAFEEAQGSLLERDGIALAGSPKIPPTLEALESIPTRLSDGSHGLRLIGEGLAQPSRSVGTIERSVVPF